MFGYVLSRNITYVARRCYHTLLIYKLGYILPSGVAAIIWTDLTSGVIKRVRFVCIPASGTSNSACLVMVSLMIVLYRTIQLRSVGLWFLMSLVMQNSFKCSTSNISWLWVWENKVAKLWKRCSYAVKSTEFNKMRKVVRNQKYISVTLLRYFLRRPVGQSVFLLRSEGKYVQCTSCNVYIWGGGEYGVSRGRNNRMLRMIWRY